MSVSYQELKRLKPASLHEASTALSAAVTKLATEHTQYKSRVVRPLLAGHAWHGGGQPDAAAVAEINGLAIDTTRLRAAAGAAAYLYACAGFVVAQTYLTTLEKQIKADDMAVDADGNVSTTYVPIGDDNGPGSVSAKVLKYQQKIAKVLAFATKVDAHAAHRLNTSHEPPLTTLTNKPGLLDQARADNADAARDARNAVSDIEQLGDEATRELPSLKDMLPDLPTYNVQIPPGAPACAWLGAILLSIGLNGVEWGAIGGLVTAIETDGVGALAGAGVSVGGALLAGLGVIFLTAGGVDIATETQISRADSSDGGGRGPSQSLDELTRQAKQVETQAKPTYQGEPRVEVDPKKYDYLFGKVRSSEHNSGRSGQIKQQLARIGVHDNPEGREMLREHFDEIADSDSNVIRTYTNSRGTYQIRDSLFAGPGGFLHLETTWEITGSGLRLTTVIPYGGP